MPTDAYERSWKSLVFYLYTGKIEFRPLKSTAASQTRSETEVSPAACSPKSMYRIAHMVRFQRPIVLINTAMQNAHFYTARDS